MLVTCQPQFETSDDDGSGYQGISSIPQWHQASDMLDSSSIRGNELEIEPNVRKTLARLRYIFQDAHISTTELHDLTCFVAHKLLSLGPPWHDPNEHGSFSLSETIRHAMVLYMLIIHGTTYYSHVHFANSLAKQLRRHLECLHGVDGFLKSLKIWAISIGMASSFDLLDRQWFVAEAHSARDVFSLSCWSDVMTHLEEVLWLRTSGDDVVSSEWQQILSPTLQ
jgi:hypothetical protein